MARPACAFVSIKDGLSVKEGCPIESHGLWRGLNFLCEIEINEDVFGSRNSWVNKGGQITTRTDSMRHTIIFGRFTSMPGIVGFTSCQYTIEPEH